MTTEDDAVSGGDEGEGEDESTVISLAEALEKHRNWAEGSSKGIALTLEYPVKVGKLQATEFQIHRMRLCDIEAVSRCTSDMERSITMCVDMTRQDRKVIQQLDMTDFNRLQELVAALAAEGNV